MKANKIKRNILNVLMVLVMLMAISLTACSSNKLDVDSTKEETTEVKEEVAELEPTAEPTLKPTPEPTSEPTPVPTPDTESTLPGIEWIQTFDGIVDTPKLVVFNDSTNKKIILEDFEEVEFFDDDTLAVYIPKERGKVTRYLLFDEVEYYDNIVTLRKVPSAIRRDGYSSATCINIEFDGKPMTLYCDLKLMGNP